MAAGLRAFAAGVRQRVAEMAAAGVRMALDDRDTP